MQKFHVTLEAPEGGQTRVMTLRARSADEARIRAEAAELEHIDYDVFKDPYLTLGVGFTNAEIDWAANRKRAEEIVRECEITDAFKVRGPSGWHRAKFHQHQQQVPYVVRAVELIPQSVIDTNRLIRELAALQHDPEAWERVLAAMRDNDTPIAAVTAWQYGVPKKNLFDGTSVWDWDTDTIKVSLHTVTYSANQDTDDFFNDATNEVTGTGYTAGGAALASKTATYDTATDQVRLDAADTSWASSTITARQAVIYKSTGTSTTSPLIGNVNFGADVSTSAGTFQITWDSTGIVNDDLT